MDSGEPIEVAWLSGRIIRILLVVKPLEIIDDYDYNEDNDDFNRLRLGWEDFRKYDQYFIYFSDGFLGFTESVLGYFSNSTET